MIGIICSLKIEVDGLKALMENSETVKKAGLEFISGKIFDKDIVLLECGIGKVNAAVGTQIMIDLYKPDVVINSGIAGSLSKNLTIGDIVISTDCVEHDINRTELDEPRGQICFTDEKIIAIPADKEVGKKLVECCHMDGAAVGHVCYMNKVPFVILRSISDDFKFNTVENYDEFKELAADRAIKALKKFIKMT